MKPSTEKKLDDIFSDYIRLRDANEFGQTICISCTAEHYWNFMDCGHFVSRKHLATRYNEKNCNSQCVHCNRERDGNTDGYEVGLIKKYGTEVIEELEREHRKTVKISEYEAQEMIKEYKLKVKELKLQKGL